VSFDAHQMDTRPLLIGAVVMLVAILAGVRVSVPGGPASPADLPADGRAAREAGLGIQFEDANVAHALGFAALVLILAEGGLTTHWAEIRPRCGSGSRWPPLGVAVSVRRVAVGCALPVRA
jgi:cell volume regulation protein A